MATLALALALAAGLTGAYAAGVLVGILPPPAFARAPHNLPHGRGGVAQPQPEETAIPVAARVAAARPAAWLAVASGGLLGVLAVMPLATFFLRAGFYLSARHRRGRDITR